MSKIGEVEKLMGFLVEYSAEISTASYSMYAVKTLKGKLIFDVKVSHETKKISLIMPDSSEVKTGGVAKMVSEISLEGVHTHVSGNSVRSYIFPRVARFMADYYIK
jgi:hypothetical protein